MIYRTVELSDIDAIAAMYVETFNAPPWNDHWTHESASKRLLQIANSEEFYGIVAYDNDELCGMIMGSIEEFYTGPMFNIKELCVKNDKRNKGYGTKIFEEYEKRLKRIGVKEIYLFTLKDERTEAFYYNRGLKNIDNMIFMSKEI